MVAQFISRLINLIYTNYIVTVVSPDLDKRGREGEKERKATGFKFSNRSNVSLMVKVVVAVFCLGSIVSQTGCRHSRQLILRGI